MKQESGYLLSATMAAENRLRFVWLIVSLGWEWRYHHFEINWQLMSGKTSPNRHGLSDPDNQFVGATVEDDVAFGLENQGIRLSNDGEMRPWSSGTSHMQNLREKPLLDFLADRSKESLLLAKPRSSQILSSWWSNQYVRPRRTGIDSDCQEN